MEKSNIDLKTEELEATNLEIVSIHFFIRKKEFQC